MHASAQKTPETNFGGESVCYLVYFDASASSTSAISADSLVADAVQGEFFNLARPAHKNEDFGKEILSLRCTGMKGVVFWATGIFAFNVASTDTVLKKPTKNKLLNELSFTC